jgi:hypothetical protein
MVRAMSRDGLVSQPRKIAGTPPRRLEIDWVKVLVNTTLVIASVSFLLIAGIMAWTLY